MKRWMQVRCWFGALVVVGLCSGQPRAQSETLITDITSHRISITSSFAGTRLTLFGTIDHFQGGGVVVVVRGPDQDFLIRRKRRAYGLWVNRDEVVASRLPGFYAAIASGKINEMAEPRILARHQIGLANLPFQTGHAPDDPQLKGFRDAFLRNQKRAGLYLELPGEVQFVGGSLFRTSIDFPAQVPIGNYIAQVFLVRDGRVISAQTTPLFVTKSGAEQRIYDFARKQPLFYGLVAVIAAGLAGGLAAFIFRKE